MCFYSGLCCHFLSLLPFVILKCFPSQILENLSRTENIADAGSSQGMRTELALSSRTLEYLGAPSYSWPLELPSGKKKKKKATMEKESLPFIPRQRCQIQKKYAGQVGEKTCFGFPASFFLFPSSVSTQEMIMGME